MGYSWLTIQRNEYLFIGKFLCDKWHNLCNISTCSEYTGWSNSMSNYNTTKKKNWRNCGQNYSLILSIVHRQTKHVIFKMEYLIYCFILRFSFFFTIHPKYVVINTESFKIYTYSSKNQRYINAIFIFCIPTAILCF